MISPKSLFLILFLFVLSNIPLLAQKKLKTENVILITLDGFRWRELFSGADGDLISEKDFVEDEKDTKALFWDEDPQVRRRKLMPFVWETLARDGQIYGNRQHENLVNLRNNHRFSYPGYNEILTGFADDNRINSNDKKDNPNKTVLEFINQQKGFHERVAAFGSWDVFPYILNVNRSGLPVNAGFSPAPGPRISNREAFLNQLQTQIPSPWSNVRLDAFTHHYAMEYLRQNSPKVLYIAYGETDDFAHNGNYQAYLKSAHQTDAFIKDLWSWLQQSHRYRNKTSLIITTDHGRGNTKKTWKNHGTLVAEADQTWFMVMGPDTPNLGEVKQPGQFYNDQLAQTLTTLLGLQYTPERPAGPVVSTVIKVEENKTTTFKKKNQPELTN